MPRFTNEAVRAKRTKGRGRGRAGSHISRAPPHNERRRPQSSIYYSVPTKMVLVYHQSAQGFSKALRKQHPKQTGLGQARACRAALVNHLLRFSHANLTVAFKQLGFSPFDCYWKKRQVAYYGIGHSKHILFSAARSGCLLCPLDWHHNAPSRPQASS